MTGRDKMRLKMGSPITLGDVVKLIISIVGLVALLGAGFVAWGKMEATTTITKTATKDKFTKIESTLEQLDDDVHAIDKRVEIMAVEQKAQTKKIDAILQEVRSN